MARSGARERGLVFDDWLARCDFGGRSELVCAVSGGADSAALLILAAQTSASCRAVHVDHGLRRASALDAAKVGELAEALDVPCDVVTVEVAEGPNLEARARAARYKALPAGVLTGHTADDQAETVLLQLLRGGGLDAVAGMRGTRRPLLALRRSDTEEVCRRFGYEWVCDESNDDPRYRRNRVRNELIPLAADIFQRDVAPLLARAAGVAGDERDLLDELAAELDPTDALALRRAHPAVARRAIRSWLRGDHPPDHATVARVMDVVRGKHIATEVGGGRRVERHRNRLSLHRSDP